MNKISIILPYYNSEYALCNQLNEYANLKLNNIEYIIIDDYSDVPLKPIKGNIETTVYRILQDIPWNQPGAKNLGVFVAKYEWLLLTDIDHIIKKETLEFISNYNLDKNTIYKFKRFDLDNDKEIHSHENSMLLHKDLYTLIGGYDEDFCGHHGYDDTFFNLELSKYSKVILPTSLYFTRKSSTTTLNRNTFNNLQLYNQKTHQFYANKYNKNKCIRFPWKKIT